MAKSSISDSSSDGSGFDPLLGDLKEKKLNFRNSVSSLVAELRDVRRQLASKEDAFVRESLMKEAAETKAVRMEAEVGRLRGHLEERNWQLEASSCNEEQYQRDLDELRTQLAGTRTAADASAASAKAAQSQCLSLMNELDEKNNALNRQKYQVSKLEEQLEFLQQNLKARETTQKQLRDDISRLEIDLMLSVVASAGWKEFELRKILEEASTKEFCIFNERLEAKNEEITKLRDEIGFLSTMWTGKALELESQLDKHQLVKEELKKKALKLEFCMQELQSQARKLQRMEETRDDTLREIKDQLPTKQRKFLDYITKHNFWESSGFKFVLSVSMLVLAVFSKG
ncbi:myosin-11-like [Iris pallida]|uniref:Myosin-11-like n=1 Tax=Iris pallida TaxID=29817 RepID=A0AAX6DWS7_IRIPA|nr:myosin-11-like [Iris pallida]